MFYLMKDGKILIAAETRQELDKELAVYSQFPLEYCLQSGGYKLIEGEKELDIKASVC